MNILHKNNWFKTLAAVLTLGIASGLHPVAAQEDEDEEVFDLSPFTVQEDEAIGYQALSTLAGTRIKTDLRDVGAAISVITQEFMEDTGATDAGTLLSYGLNTEVSGEQGNFAGPSLGGAGGINAGDPTLDNQRANPQENALRVRGLAAASITRGFFLTDIPFDSYNTTGVTINRGPNSLLFGVGSPGGIINNGVKQAILGNTFGQIGIRFGENGSHRETLDYNMVLIEDVLSVRIAAMNEELDFHQKPAYEEDSRVHLAAQLKLFTNDDSDIFGNTIIRMNYEDGSIEGTPVNVIPPRDGYGGWFAPQVDRSIESITGVTLPGYIDNSSAERGLFSPKTVINTLPGARPGFNGFPNQHSAWALQPIVYNDVNSSVSSVGFPGRPEVDGTLGLTNWQLTDARAQRGQFATLATTTIYRNPWTPGFTQHISAVIPKVGDTYTLSWLDHPRPSLNPAGVPAGSTLATYVPGTGDPSFYNDFRVRSLFTSGSRSEQVITSEALAWQSKWWNGNIVGLMGWRTDETVNTGQANVGGRLPDGNADPGQLMLAAESDDPLPSGSTRTNSVVVHIPDELIDFGSTNVSFHWNESENFSPSARRIDIRGDTVAPPNGHYGRLRYRIRVQRWRYFPAH